MFAVGCVFAEMLTLKPLFPGKSEIDQIHKVFTMLGQPTHFHWPEGIKLLDRIKISIKKDDPLIFNDDHRVDEKVLYNLSLERSKADLAKAVPSSDQVTLSFLHKLLMIDPNDRPSAKEAILDPFFISRKNVDRDRISHKVEFTTEYDIWVNGGQKSNGLPSSTPYLEVEAARQKRRNESRSIACGNSDPFSISVPLNTMINGINAPRLTDFDFQHPGSIGNNSGYGSTFQTITPPISDDPSFLNFNTSAQVNESMSRHNPFALYDTLGIGSQMES